MKKYLSILLLVISTIVFGQLKIKDNSNDWALIGQSSQRIQLFRKGEQAKFIYIDIPSIQKFYASISSTLYEFAFTITDSDLNEMYNLIIDKLKSKAKENITLEFPEGDIELHFLTGDIILVLKNKV
jgi:hypothetical protein